MKYRLDNVCDFGLELNSQKVNSVFFFVVVDTLRPVALCHVFATDEQID